MAIKFPCPHCQMPLRIDERFAGRQGKCPACSIKVSVPKLRILPSAKALSPDDNQGILGNKPARPNAGHSASHHESGEGLQYDDTSIHSVSGESGLVSSSDDRAQLVIDISHALESADSIPNRGSTFEDIAVKASDHRSRAQSVDLRNQAEDGVTTKNALSIPRWVVMTQGALLGTVAFTFFIFGWMVGSLSSPQPAAIVASGKVELTGSVFATQEGERVPDMGAVIVVIPSDATPEHRPDMSQLHPDNFRPAENEAKSLIESVGGQVVRANSDGKFVAFVEESKVYQILVISKRATVDSNFGISKQMRAEFGSFFLPLEDLLKRQAFHWEEVVVGNHNKVLNVVVF
ncbi:MAG TPA: hypothetical protein PKD64_14905 [Pirellulaceae bacterium]|nr:hypothetical protein [Pirellulaceae bacterium]HMO93472.1 hypothetical protein [Pirellulaceae bacterium]HMP69213.1 hypothetical protein [Pirellulaceae bacterium]